MKIVIVIQARTASTRLPRKVLSPICGRKVLDIVITRCQRIEGVDDLVVATSESSEDRQIIELAEKLGVKSFAGSESDVLNRFYGAACHHNADAVVRITADCPMLDPGVSSLVVSKFRTGEWDYVSNIKPPTYPDGLDTEVFSIEALERAEREAMRPSHREHVTPYIWSNPGEFRLANIEHHRDLSHIRWTLDNAADLKMMRRLCEKLEVDFTKATMADFLGAWEADTSLAEMSSPSRRNEALEAQLKQER